MLYVDYDTWWDRTLTAFVHGWFVENPGITEGCTEEQFRRDLRGMGMDDIMKHLGIDSKDEFYQIRFDPVAPPRHTCVPRDACDCDDPRYENAFNHVNPSCPVCMCAGCGYLKEIRP